MLPLSPELGPQAPTAGDPHGNGFEMRLDGNEQRRPRLRSFIGIGASFGDDQCTVSVDAERHAVALAGRSR